MHYSASASHKVGSDETICEILDKDCDCFNYIAKTFPGLSMEKLKAGIFDGPHVRKLMQDQTFTDGAHMFQ